MTLRELLYILEDMEIAELDMNSDVLILIEQKSIDAGMYPIKDVQFIHTDPNKEAYKFGAIILESKGRKH